jgi:hypothetical protein
MTNAKKMNRAETGPESTVDNRVPADREQADATRTDAMPVEPRQADRHAAQKQVEPTRADTRQVEPKSADTARGPLAAPGATGAPNRVTAGSTRRDTGLIGGDDVERYRNDWRSVQSGFVDDPAASVREADALVGRLFDTIASRIAQQRSALAERRPDESADRTEQLRLALRDYRTMFEQLLPGRRG